MPSVLITGSNRGLGLEWARQLSAQGWRVYAACRDPEGADALGALAEGSGGRVELLRLDVTRPQELAEAADRLGDKCLDLLVNNAGIYLERWDRDPLGSIDYALWEETFRVNVLGQVRVAEALVEPLARGERPLVVSISSHMGSIADIGQPRSYAYRSSKAALNAAMMGLSYELAERGIGLLLLHPGWVRTDMGGSQAPYSPEESVAGMRRRVAEYTPEHRGRFLRFDGVEMPW